VSEWTVLNVPLNLNTSKLVLVKKTKTSTSVKGTNVYPHMPIVRPHAARYIVNVFKFQERRISSVKFTSAHLYGNVYMRVGVACALTDSSDFWLLGSKVHNKLWFPALDDGEPPSKMWRQ